VRPGSRLLAELDRHFRAALPVAEQALDLFEERLPLDVAGHRQDAAVGPEQLLIVAAHALRGQRFDAFDGAATVVAQRRGIVVLAQFEHDLLARLIFKPLDVLKGQRFDRIEFIGGQMRAAQDVGVQLKGGRQVVATVAPQKRM